MLEQLTIRNFALIEEETVRFPKGFSAITGETGAGKSVLMGALRTVIGGKTSPSMVRHGSDRASVEATFDISSNADARQILDEQEIESDGELIISREILSNGKSRARVNGSVVNLSTLERLGETLVQMHGQSDQLLLRDLRTQLSLFDSFAETAPELSAYTAAWNHWKDLQAKLKTTEENARALAEQKEFLAFQKNELEKAALKNGEEAELEAKTSSAAKSEAKVRAVEELREIFEGDSGLLSQFESFQHRVKQFAMRLPELEAWSEKLSEAYDSLSFVEDALQNAAENQEIDPREIDRANARLATIQRLKRKYRTDESGLIELFHKRKQELDSLENLDADLEDLQKQIQASEKKLSAAAEILSAKRMAGKQKLDPQVEEILHTLGMPKARFVTDIRQEAFSATGTDRVEFRIAPNTGEGEKPLREAVSGGELSRVLLAFKSVMASQDRVPVLVFDEVDSGISGEVGNNIGDALRKIGEFHQVLSITHLQQVACRAASHFAVEKHENSEGRTLSGVKLLSYPERIVEIARMLGDAKSPISTAHAQKLLEEQNAVQ